MSLLEVNGLNSYYGDSHILFDVSMRVERNEVVALLGRNGAGKSTTLKSLMGVVTPKAGSVVFDGIDVAGRKSHKIAQAGMQLVHEERRIFGSLNVEENLVLAGGCVEVPLGSAVLLERNGEGVVVRADQENFAAVGLFAPAVHDLKRGGKVFGGRFIMGVVAGEDNVRRTGTEDGDSA